MGTKSRIKRMNILRNFAAIYQRETIFLDRKLPPLFWTFHIRICSLMKEFARCGANSSFKSSCQWEGRPRIFLFHVYHSLKGDGLCTGRAVHRAVTRPRWLSWMHRPTGDQEVAGSTPAEVGNILSWILIMKYFLRSFSPFRWFKKGSCQFLAKECAQYWLTA